MATISPWQCLCRIVNRVTKAKNRPNSRFSSFSRAFSALLTGPTAPSEIVFFLLDEGLRHNASDIHLEPAAGGGIDIYFRIDRLLLKAATIKAPETPVLRTAIQNQSRNQRRGQYDVIKSTIAITGQEHVRTFSVYDIPQATENCILIRPCPLPIDGGTTGPYALKQPHTPRNIDKKIFIWQMGKVGSLSIYSSLFRYSTPTTWQPPTIKYDTDWPRHNNIIQTHSAKLLYDFLHYSDEEFVIISLVRDLMARNISTIFQSMNFKEEWRNHFYIASEATFKRMPYELQEREITRHLHALNSSTLATGWFDNLLRSHFYYPDIDQYFIDIYAKPFDQEKGFQIYESKTPRVKMIILRLEDLNVRRKELGDFLEIENFQLALGNAPEGKWYEPIYKRFKERYRPTEQELEAVYNSRFMRYFYSEEQITSLTQKWQ